MKVIDEDGNLFGYVNVVDALVLIVVVTLAAAGAAVVGFTGNSTSGGGAAAADTKRVGTATVYATIDLDTQPEYLVRELRTGDRSTLGPGEDLTITDIHVTPQGSKTRTRLRVALDGPVENRSVSFGGEPVRLGRSIRIATNDYTLSGTVRDVGNRTSLETVRYPVLLRAKLDASRARALSPGDTYRVAGRTVGTIETLRVYATTDPDEKLVYVGLSLASMREGNHLRFGDRVLREGSPVTFRTSEYVIEGRIVRLNATAEPGTETTREVRLRLADVPPDRAERIREGTVERAGGRTIARIEDVTREPSRVVLTSDDGEIFVREHPVNRTLDVTAELLVRETPTGLRFKGRSIQPGSTVTLSLEGRTVRMTVESL